MLLRLELQLVAVQHLRGLGVPLPDDVAAAQLRRRGGTRRPCRASRAACRCVSSKGTGEIEECTVLRFYLGIHS